MPGHVRYSLTAAEQRIQESCGMARIAVELDVLVGNKEVIVANCIVGKKYLAMSKLIPFLALGIPPKVLLHCLYAFGLDFYGELNTNGS